MMVLDKSKFDVAVPCVAASVPAPVVGSMKKEARMQK